MIVLIAQAVAGFSIGVVDQEVEEGDLLELFVELLLLFEREIMLVGIAVDVQLHHARPVRAVAQDRRRDDEPIERLADDKRRDFAVAQGAIRKIPQRTFAVARFVNGQGLPIGLDDADQESIVAAPRQQSPRFDFAVSQQIEDTIE